jgi:hypothetical protein
LVGRSVRFDHEVINDNRELFMGKIRSIIQRLPTFTLFAGIGLTFGLLVPTIFEFGESQSSRNDFSRLEFLALIVFLITTLVSGLIWFFGRPTEFTEDDSHVRFQFGIRHILIATTLVAFLFAAASFIEIDPQDDWLFWIVLGILVGLISWTLFQRAEVRRSVGTVLASLFLPFVWVIAFNRPFGHASGMLPSILFGPGLFPAMLLRQGVDNSVWIAVIFVFLEIATGVLLAFRWRKLCLAYAAFCLLLSGFTSLILHVMYRV